MDDFGYMTGGGGGGGSGGGGGKAASSSASSASAIDFGNDIFGGGEGSSALPYVIAGAVALLAFVAVVFMARK